MPAAAIGDVAVNDAVGEMQPGVRLDEDAAARGVPG